MSLSHVLLPEDARFLILNQTPERSFMIVAAILRMSSVVVRSVAPTASIPARYPDEGVVLR